MIFRRYSEVLILGMILGFSLLNIGQANGQESYTPIMDIQYTTDPSGDSPLVGQDVTTEGIVTAVFSNGIFIEDPTGGPWSGLFVYTPYMPEPPVLGYRLSMTGTIAEYYGLTEMTDVTAYQVLSGGNSLPDPVILTTGEVSQEQWEGVLVRVENVTVSNEDLGYGEWAVDDNSGYVVIDDRGSYTYVPALGDFFSAIVGPLDYSFAVFKIQPRDNLDLITGAGDECPEDPNKTAPGVCGPDRPAGGTLRQLPCDHALQRDPGAAARRLHVREHLGSRLSVELAALAHPPVGQYCRVPRRSIAAAAA